MLMKMKMSPLSKISLNKIKIKKVSLMKKLLLKALLKIASSIFRIILKIMSKMKICYLEIKKAKVKEMFKMNKLL
jgi:hypothetical protein